MGIKTRAATLLMAGAAVAALAGGAAMPAHAETLADAIALAYQSNPTLQRARAQQRALDETYVVARAGWRPSVSVSGNMRYSDTSGLGDSNSGGVSLSASQPIFTGGRTSAEVRAAMAGVMAGREGLRGIEGDILQAVVQAFEDVRRDFTILGIRQNNVELLTQQLNETQTRFEVGQVTRTDVAQAQAQLAAAKAQLSSSTATLQNSRASYATLVGRNPGDLVEPANLPGLPVTIDQAFDAAEAENPDLRHARLTEEASRARVAGAKAAGLPTVSLSASLGYSGQVAPFDVRDYSRAVSAQATVTQPLFSGGVIRSNVRRSLENNNSDRIQIESVRRAVVQSVSQAWNSMLSARANVSSDEEGVKAATVAFDGMREQYRVGLSTTLDVLIAQERLRDAELALAQARRDRYVAEAALLNNMGRLEVARVVTGAPVYDPTASFDEVKNQGAVPWEHLVQSLDSMGAPADPDPSRPIPAPQLPGAAVVMQQANTAPPVDAPYSTAVPTTPRATPAP